MVSAHRLVLSACSDFFKKIFYSNTHSHPMLYLDGVDSTDINLMLDYMYQGEVQIHQEHLDRFLEGANKFKLEGLMGSDVEHSDDMKTENVKHSEDGEDEDLMLKPLMKKNIQKQNIAQKPRKESAVRFIQDPSQMIDASNIDVKQLYQELILKENGNYKCTVCEKSMGHKASMERHVEIHMTGLSYECKNCGETFRSRVTLKWHSQSNH